jgi:hypothetical protein
LWIDVGWGMVQYDKKLHLPQNNSSWFIEIHGKADTIHRNIEQ